MLYYRSDQQSPYRYGSKDCFLQEDGTIAHSRDLKESSPKKKKEKFYEKSDRNLVGLLR